MINTFKIIGLVFLVFTATINAADELKVHGIFRSNMVIQRDKPIRFWGWSAKAQEVMVQFGNKNKKVKANEEGRWEVVFAAQEANRNGQTLKVLSGSKTIVMENILVGDIWVMNGQSNMAFALKAVYQNHFESSMAHLPLLRHIRINSGAESEHVEKDIKDQFINNKDSDKNWKVVTPEVAMEMGAIGYIFGSRLQQSLQIPIGIIDNARGGASLESLVPRHKFADHSQATDYLKWVDGRNKAFDEEAFMKKQLENYEKKLAQVNKKIAENKAKGIKRNPRMPRKPGPIRTWSVPGRSPSDAASCYNGMFGFFKGLNIKGVAFHQGFNNSMMNTSCKPKFYRILMKLMVEGWRDDFKNPNLPVAIIGFCAGGQSQTRLNFEEKGFSTAAYIREAQRLGLSDAGSSENTAFIPAYDQKIPQLHTKKKKELGIRTARWALKTVYGKSEISWESAKVVSVTPEDGKLLITFDRAVYPDDIGSEVEGFSVADESGNYFIAKAKAKATKDRSMRNKQYEVSSPLVAKPVSLRYAWARSPMGNLKVEGKPWQPLHSFRTDEIDFAAEVSHQDPEGHKKNSAIIKEERARVKENLQKRLAGMAK